MVYSTAAYGASDKNGVKARNFLGTWLYVNHRVLSVPKNFDLSSLLLAHVNHWYFS